MAPILAGDIGGTKILLRLADTQTALPTTSFEARYASQEYAHLNDVVRIFYEAAAQHLGAMPRPQSACFGIAGPVVGNTSALTNLNWSLDGKMLASDLDIPTVELINDFAAVGYGVLGTGGNDLSTLQAAPAVPQATIAVIGAGTGLGEAFLTWTGDRYEVHATEGGHTDFAPRSPWEDDLLRYLRARHGRVSVERVVSGQGVVAVYQFLRDAAFAQDTADIEPLVGAWERGEANVDPAAAIANAALEGRDRRAEKTMELFLEAYGAAAGNLALQVLPYGGLYVAGGIAPKILPLLQRGNFQESFLQKGRLRSVLEKIPVHIVLRQDIGLLGAAIYAATLSEGG